MTNPCQFNYRRAMRPRLSCSEAPVVNENITGCLAGTQSGPRIPARPTPGPPCSPPHVPSASSGLLPQPVRPHPANRFSQLEPPEPTSSHRPGRGRSLCTSRKPSVEGDRQALILYIVISFPCALPAKLYTNVVL